MGYSKCNHCDYEIPFETNTCPNCGKSIGIEIGGIKGLLTRIMLIIIAIYIFLSAVSYF